MADFDLDRVIGGPEPRSGEAPAGVSSSGRGEVEPFGKESDAPALPLFTRGRSDGDDKAPIAPPPARPPLAVRRATPEVARRRTPRTIRRDDGLDLQLESAAASAAEGPSSTGTAARQATLPAAPSGRRLGAALVDVILLGGIDVAVLYLTLAIAGLSMADVLTLPLVPMGAFLLLINGGYLVAFTVANGQTIGKMLFGVRVIGDDDRRVDIGGALLRSAGVLLSMVTLGLAYLPVLLSRDGRALHDRIAGTRVIEHA